MKTTRPKSEPASRQKHDLVYGMHGDELVVMPEARARHLAQTWNAMMKAKTWGALKKLAPPKAYREILAFQESPRSIRASHAFDYYEMTPVPDGDYPGFPKQEVVDWMPPEVVQLFGEMHSTWINGDYPGFDPANTQQLVAMLRKMGYRCRRNQRLIDAAHGD